MRGFFELPAGERAFLVVLALLAAASFLPWWRELHFAGMAVFGWLMAVLMLLSPTLAILLVLSQKDRRCRKRAP